MSVDELRAGGWVKRGHVWANPRMEAAAAEAEEIADDTVDHLMAVLEWNLSTRAVATTRAVAQRACTDCGCLLHPGETCPACRWTLVRWCEDADIRASWRPIPYGHDQAQEVIAA